MLTPVAFVLLRQLADGQTHSGETLGATIGMSRARVSRLLKQMEEFGLALDRVRGRGYRLTAATPLLDRAEIMQSLDLRAAELRVDVVDHVDSTSSELLRRNTHEDTHRLLLATEWQTAGRGRGGRRWESIVGGSLTFSLGWRFEQGAGFVSGVSLAMGVAIARALEASGFAGIELKWPNDLVHGGRKVGGILIELSGDARGPSLLVIGVGLNVRLSDAVRGDIAQPVTDLAAIAGAVDRNVLLARIAAEMVRTLEQYARSGFVSFRAEWQRRHALQNQPVDVLRPDGSVVRGSVAGVDVDGALLLDHEGRLLRFISGEVSLRRSGR